MKRQSFTGLSARHKIFPAAEHARLGAYLRSVRVAHDISQRELAAKLGLPQSYVSKVERGERHLQVLELIEICQKIGVTTANFFDGLAIFTYDPSDVPKATRKV